MSSKRIKIDLDSSIAAALAAGPGRPKKPAAPPRSKATYDLRPGTIQQIKEIAAALEVPVYAVAQRLLDYALAQREQGRLELTRQPVTTTWRLE